MEPASLDIVERARGRIRGLAGQAFTHTILYAPGLEEMALGIAAEIEGAGPALCTSDFFADGCTPEQTGLCWEAFPSGDPNLKLRVEAVKDKHVVLVMNHDTLHLCAPRARARRSRARLAFTPSRPSPPPPPQRRARGSFEQLSVLLFLQRFNVPHALEAYARDKWKATMADGAYDECSVASLTVVVPWYRHCQMERTCRWAVDAERARWYNGEPHGA